MIQSVVNPGPSDAIGPGFQPGRSIALGILFIYRKAVSPLLLAWFGPACRFDPPCSAYAAQAIDEYGLLRGGAMTLQRLGRCHPLGSHGYDPVPIRSPQE